jgi:DNA (cytosine-5)-methyltransferase 1
MSAVTGFLAAGALAFTPIEVDGLFIDGFAGGGGASTGIEQAIGRSVDIAINHSPTAIAIHKANHPGTTHYCQDIKALWPLAATRMQPVAGAWFSPDCKEFSKAKGGPVKDRSIRALCWEVVHWLQEVRPTCGYLENVEEFEYAAPLDAAGFPIKGQEGREFKRFVRAIRALGYRVQWRILVACDYGAPTSRKRLYMVMRCDGKPIVWPKPTHGKPGSAGVRSGQLLPYRTAAECIDWSIPCPSIFDRKKDLVDASCRRVAHGVMRYVVDAAEPFIIPVTHTQSSPRTNAASKPLPTITTANGGEFAAVDVTIAPHITKFRTGSIGSPMAKEMPTVTANGEPERPAGATPLGLVGATLATLAHGERRRGEQPRSGSLGVPLSTTHSGGGNHAAVTAFLSSFYTSDKAASGGNPEQPLRTVRAGGGKGGVHHAVVAAHIEQANTGMVGRAARKPLSTIVGKGCTQRIVQTTMVEEGALPPEMMERAVKVAAFLVKYYATDGENEASQSQAANRPLDTVTTRARFAVVTVTIDAKTYVIVDIGLRMLKPRELARAQGFPESYILNPVVRKLLRGKWVERELTIAEQISAIGNSVCPPVARALVAANQPSATATRLAA